MGWTFLWAGMDTVFGLGFPTDTGWIDGGNPTYGFLTFSHHGPLYGFYSFCARSFAVKLGLVSGLFVVGSGLLMGTWVRIAALAGAAIYLVMWTARFPPTNNPLTDDHLMGALIMTGLALSNPGTRWSLAYRWRRLPLVSSRSYLW